MNIRLQPALPWRHAGGGIIALALLAGCGADHGSTDTASAIASNASTLQQPKYAADIRRTAHGIAHIKASDEGSLGYGVGYAYAQDNFCLLADEFVTVNGERSKYFGAGASGPNPALVNLQTDYFYKLINDPAAVANAWQQQSATMRALIEGYAAGYNRYLEQTGGDRLAQACRNAAWVRPITSADMIRLYRRYAAEGGAGQFIASIVGAAPPGVAPAALAPPAAKVNPFTPEYWKEMHAQTGSNAVALGRDGSANGQGLLLSNPHFPWQGALRFYQLHLTIPGKLDVMGASLAGIPLVNIGFNNALAWGHTVNTSAHFTAHLLLLDPANPTRYLYDGQVRSMDKRTVSIDVKAADGSVVQQSRDFYSTPMGMLGVVPGQLDWNAATAYTIHDANLDNHRMLEQWYGMNRSRSLAEFKYSVEKTVGLPWVNTIAADTAGNALYMDVTVVPHVSKLKQALCVPAPFQPLAAQGLFVLNGALSACQWGTDAGAPQRGIFAGSSLPRLVRSDYVQNSNDSAWLSNPAAPLRGFPDIVSREGYEQSGRTRMGISQIQKQLAARRMTMAQLQTLTLSNRVYYADQMMDDLLGVCAGDTSAACAKLAQWDRSANLDANIGYAYFTNVFDRVRSVPGLWTVPFNPFDPVNTPRGLNMLNPLVNQAVREAFAASITDAAAQGWQLDTLWGQLQGVTRNGGRIAIHGGADRFGVYNAIDSVPIGGGLREVVMGSSYIQTVGFDRNGPRAQAVLSYSQSTDPASPYYSDQTELFSRKTWVSLPFTDAEIAADPALQRMTISGK